MTVIPFNPGSGARKDDGPLPKDTTGSDDRGGRARTDRRGRGSVAGNRAAAQDADSARAARLEHALIAALRENATNWARAERAERAERVLRERMLEQRGPAPSADRG